MNTDVASIFQDFIDKRPDEMYFDRETYDSVMFFASQMGKEKFDTWLRVYEVLSKYTKVSGSYGVTDEGITIIRIMWDKKDLKILEPLMDEDNRIKFGSVEEFDAMLGLICS